MPALCTSAAAANHDVRFVSLLLSRQSAPQPLMHSVFAGSLLQQQSMLWAVRAQLAAGVPGSTLSLVSFGMHSAGASSRGPPPEAHAATALARTLFMESRAAYGTAVDLPLACSPEARPSDAARTQGCRPTLAAFRSAACDSGEYALRLDSGR